LAGGGKLFADLVVSIFDGSNDLFGGRHTGIVPSEDIGVIQLAQRRTLNLRGGVLMKGSVEVKKIGEKALTVVRIYIYGQYFNLSRLGTVFGQEEENIWIDIDPDDENKKVRVTSNKELVDFIRNNVIQAPSYDEMILFNVKDAVFDALNMRFLFDLIDS
jgi:hypothetical protein